MVEHELAQEACNACDHGAPRLILQGEEGEKLLPHQERRNADNLPEHVLVQHFQIGLLGNQKPRQAGRHGERHSQSGHQGDAEGNQEIDREQLRELFSFRGHIPAVEDLRAADQHDARRGEEEVDRSEKPDCAHRRRPDGVAGIEGVYDPVDRVDDKQQNLIGQEPEIQLGQQLVFVRFLFQVQHPHTILL